MKHKLYTTINSLQNTAEQSETAQSQTFRYSYFK